MAMTKEEKLRKFQDIIGYRFRNEDFLVQSLTTPRLANETGEVSYDFLETLGDAVIKLIFILKLYKSDIIKFEMRLDCIQLEVSNGKFSLSIL